MSQTPPYAKEVQYYTVASILDRQDIYIKNLLNSPGATGNTRTPRSLPVWSHTPS